MLSLDAPPEEPAPHARPAAKGGKKVEFSLTPDDAAAFPYADARTGAEMKAALTEACSDPNAKKPTIKQMEEFLAAQGLIALERLPTQGFYYLPTERGIDAGIRSEDRVSARGTPYAVLQFTPDAQRLIVEHFTRSTPND